MNNKKTANNGFTLIEILVVIGIIAILAAIVIIAINPARQFAQARNSQRSSNVNALLNAIGQNIADNKGLFNCPLGSSIPTSSAAVVGSSTVNIRPCIVPTYMPEIPVDPVGGISCPDDVCTGGYDTKYTVVQSSSTARITVCAPNGAETAIASSTAICVTR